MKFINKFKKSEKGAITLFVLTTLLFVLLVLGVAYINISNKGTNQDKKIKQIAKQYQVTNEDMEQKYQEVLDNANLTIEQVQNDGMFEKKTNTETTDVNGNKIVIPAGFKVRVDDTTNNANTVNEGIVIEDKKGNQFVWIPVGDVKIDTVGTTVNIPLGRYDFTNGTQVPYSGSFTEDTGASHDNRYKNSIAKNITNFLNNSNGNHGYYIGRYESGVANYDTTNIITTNDNKETNWTGYNKISEGAELELVCKQGQQPWNYVTQNKASELARNMYVGKTYESDLINSYAWDTAIAFIQTCGTKTNSKAYSQEIGKLTDESKVALTGTGVLNSTKTADEQCNIYDMAGNVSEWTTETARHYDIPCVNRGGIYNKSGDMTCTRVNYDTTIAIEGNSFRVLLDVNS